MLICFNDVCKYNANCGDCLFRGDIILDDEGACNCFEDYSKQPEYQTIFFKACSGDDGKLHKVIAKGRKTTEGGFTLYYETQGTYTFSQPMREMGAAFEDKIVNYNNNPILKWCLSNTAKKEIGISNIMPDKISAKRRIDGMVSLLNAWVVYVRDFEDYMYNVG